MDENIIIKRLEEGKDLNILLLSHNAYWSEYLKLDNKYDNLILQKYGSNPNYILMNQESREITDCDLIIYFSFDHYNEEDLDYLKEIAFNVSNCNNKRVSIGYSYGVDMSERVHKDYADKIKLVSFYNGEETCLDTYFPSPYSDDAFTLGEITLNFHDEVNTKNKIYTK